MRHRIKPVNEMINYCMNILYIVANGETKKSENEIYRALIALNDKGLKFKRDAIDALHKLAENHVLKVERSNNHPQRYEVELAPLGNELVSLRRNVEQCISIYEDLVSTVKKNIVADHDISFRELKTKILAENSNLEDPSFQNQSLEVGLNFMVETLFVIILALSSSYIRLLSKIKDNEYALAILNEIFSTALRRDVLLQKSNQEILLNNVLAQIELPITQYFVDYRYNMDLHGNKFLKGRPYNLMNSIYSIIEPGTDMNFNNLLKYIMTLKEKNILFESQGLARSLNDHTIV